MKSKDLIKQLGALNPDAEVDESGKLKTPKRTSQITGARDPKWDKWDKTINGQYKTFTPCKN